MQAVDICRGDFVMFLEPHCTFQPYWLEPLISRIVFNDQFRNDREQVLEEEKGVGGV